MPLILRVVAFVFFLVAALIVLVGGTLTWAGALVPLGLAAWVLSEIVSGTAVRHG